MLGALAGCDARGFSARETEFERVRQGPFTVISASTSRAVVEANGRQVAIEPTDGFCLAEESIETSGRSAFALIGDCVLSETSGNQPRAANGELQLPKGLPGFLTVSVSGGPGFGSDASTEPDLEELRAFLATPDGLRMLGRGGTAEGVDVKTTRQIGDTLYLLVEDKNASAVPLFASTFWRAFVELNDRLAVVTISGFRDRPMTEDEMLKYLVSQVRKLREANRFPINEEQTLIAERTPRSRTPVADEPQLISDLEADAVIITAENETAEIDTTDSTVPAPPPRPALGGPVAEDLSNEAPALAEDASKPAENTALLAGVVLPPSRPGSGQTAPQTQPPQAAQTEPLAEIATPETVLTNPAANVGTAPEAEAAPATPNAPQSAPVAPRRPRRA